MLLNVEKKKNKIYLKKQKILASFLKRNKEMKNTHENEMNSIQMKSKERKIKNKTEKNVKVLSKYDIYVCTSLCI